jgi:hypothetical protein
VRLADSESIDEVAHSCHLSFSRPFGDLVEAVESRGHGAYHSRRQMIEFYDLLLHITFQ